MATPGHRPSGPHAPGNAQAAALRFSESFMFGGEQFGSAREIGILELDPLPTPTPTGAPNGD
jgi:hypothetical protein